jgi:hypothetical protein
MHDGLGAGVNAPPLDDSTYDAPTVNETCKGKVTLSR